jgi:hypothetical protein
LQVGARSRLVFDGDDSAALDDRPAAIVPCVGAAVGRARVVTTVASVASVA